MHTHIKDFLEDQKKKQTLRFITCGSVDDGKSLPVFFLVLSYPQGVRRMYGASLFLTKK